MLNVKKTVVGILIALTVSGASHADDIVLAADVWPPFINKPGAEQAGYMVEVAQKVFAKKGHKIVFKEQPWSRAVNLCRKGDIPGIVGAAVGDAPDFVFPKEELGILDNYMFTLKDSTWTYKGGDSFKSVKLGLIQDYEYGEETMKYIKANKGSKMIQFVSGNDPLAKNIKKLAAKRVDVVIEVKPVFDSIASELGLADKFKAAGSDGNPSPIYICFSPANPKSKEYAKILSDGVIEMRKSGELAKILSAYGQKDWK